MKKLIQTIKDTLSIFSSSKGFTLLELLVVVLIIGILAAIALPQYRRTVEKAKVAEALVNVKAIEGAMQRYILTNGYPSNQIYFKDFADIELSGGYWRELGDDYFTKNFTYYSICSRNGCGIEVYRQKKNADLYALSDVYALIVFVTQEGVSHSCITQLKEMGRYICKYLEPQGWQYIDDEY